MKSELPQKRARPPLPTSDTPAVEAARRLLSFHYKTLLSSVPGAIRGERREPLHDFRVANRRLRVLFRTFKKHLPRSSVQQLYTALHRLSTALGPARDLDVRIEFLRRAAGQSGIGRSVIWRTFLDSLRQCRQEQQTVVRQHLSDRSFLALKTRLRRFFRTELPGAAKASSPGSLRKLASTKLLRALRRVRHNRPLWRTASTKKLHKLRILVRRARYLAEFFAGVLAPPARKLAARLHRVDRALGLQHDIDLLLEQIQRRELRAPPELAEFLEKRKGKIMKRVARSWERLMDSSYQRRVHRQLKKAHPR